MTGQNLDWFFEQWLYLKGHPKFHVTKSWDAKTGMLHLNVKQTQEVTRLWPVFRVVGNPSDVIKAMEPLGFAVDDILDVHMVS